MWQKFCFLCVALRSVTMSQDIIFIFADVLLWNLKNRLALNMIHSQCYCNMQNMSQNAIRSKSCLDASWRNATCRIKIASVWGSPLRSGAARVLATGLKFAMVDYPGWVRPLPKMKSNRFSSTELSRVPLETWMGHLVSVMVPLRPKIGLCRPGMDHWRHVNCLFSMLTVKSCSTWYFWSKIGSWIGEGVKFHPFHPSPWLRHCTRSCSQFHAGYIARNFHKFSPIIWLKINVFKMDFCDFWNIRECFGRFYWSFGSL